MTITTQGIDHIGLAVEDPKRSAEWYMRLLGLERRFEDAWGDRPMVVGAEGTSLAFFERESDSDPLVRGITPTSGHIAFRVDGENFSKAKAALAREGLETRFADYRISRSLHFRDPDGYHLEITTYDLNGSE